MKLVVALLLATTMAPAQQPHKAATPPNTQLSSEAQIQQANMNSVWQAELPNMKSDLAELRSMLNVMGAQEMSVDSRSSAAFQTNRQMWQIVIARLAELTQRMDALERSQAHRISRPQPEQP